MRLDPITSTRDIRHGHLFCGIGGGAKGFNRARPRVGNVQGRFVCQGGIDNDAGAIRNFELQTGAKGTVLDMFSREQFTSFHGKEPPFGWREATPADIILAFGPVLDVLFLSAPCKGFSGLLSATQSKTDKYQALNGLTLRGIWLVLEAYKDNPIPVILFENVPRILTRGRWLLDQIIALLRSYGYSVNLDTHDCGVIGNLAQSRKRALLIARHTEKIPPFIYQPKHHRLRGVGEVIGKLPLPGDPVAGPMHRVPSLQWKTWVRLAFVPAGKDWRALNDLAVENGTLRDFGVMPEHPLRDNALGVNGWCDTAPVITAQRAPGQGRFAVADPRVDGDWNADVMGVREWKEPTGTVAGRNSPTNGAFSVADPRTGFGEGTHHNVLHVTPFEGAAKTISSANHPSGGALSVADPRVDGHPRSVQLGVRAWEQTAACVKGDVSVGTGPYAIADPRLEGKPRFNNTFRIVPFDGASPAVAGPGGPAGGLAVADPRHGKHENYSSRKYKVTPFENPARAVIGASTTGDGAFAVADPRGPHEPDKLHGKYPVNEWDAETRAVIAGRDNGAFAVADPRAFSNDQRPHYQTGGHYGVVAWPQTGYSVSGSACHDNGFNSVADPREVDLDVEPIALPGANDRLICRIIATDNTWHRPFTTLDLGALQSLFDPEEIFFFENDAWQSRMAFDLVGGSDVTKREWIGNMVPGDAATGMAETIGEAILLADQGETFFLDSRQIWVKPGALALAVDNDQIAFRMDADGR